LGAFFPQAIISYAVVCFSRRFGEVPSLLLSSDVTLLVEFLPTFGKPSASFLSLVCTGLLWTFFRLFARDPSFFFPWRTSSSFLGDSPIFFAIFLPDFLQAAARRHCGVFPDACCFVFGRFSLGRCQGFLGALFVFPMLPFFRDVLLHRLSYFKVPEVS